MLDRILRLFRRSPKAPRAPLELTALDQWVLRVLFRGDGRAYLKEEDVAEAVLAERPALIPHEVRGAVRKMAVYGLAEQNDAGWYRASGRGRKLKDVVPLEPTVNMDVYL